MTFIFFTIPSWQLFYILHLKWQLSTIVCVLCLFRLLLNTDTVITNHTIIRAFFTMHAFVYHLPAVILKCWLNAIKTWVRNFEATGSILKKKGGSVRTVHRPENIAVVREATERSPHGPARRNSVSDCLKPAFDGFYTKIFTSTRTKFKLLVHYMNVTM